MFHSEYTAELQRILMELRNSAKNDDGVRLSGITRVEMLVAVVGSDEFPKRFHELLEAAQNSNNRTSDNWYTIFDGMCVILDTKFFIESVSVRSNGDLDIIPFFEPDNTDRQKMLEGCKQLRTIVNDSLSLDAKNRNRLLKRISAMEIEINKSNGLLDTILAASSDIGEAVGKFGGDIKPMTDRIREITSIAKKSSQEYSSRIQLRKIC